MSDLVQEGSLGLIRAAEKVRKGLPCLLARGRAVQRIAGGLTYSRGPCWLARRPRCLEGSSRGPFCSRGPCWLARRLRARHTSATAAEPAAALC
eukprot:5432326-Prymnesium_polylepis.2